MNCDIESNAKYITLIKVQPAKALPNKRKVKDNNGAHIDNKLIGKKNGNGSIYLLKYFHFVCLIEVACIKTKVIKPKDNGIAKFVIGDGKPVKPNMNAKNK